MGCPRRRRVVAEVVQAAASEAAVHVLSPKVLHMAMRRRRTCKRHTVVEAAVGLLLTFVAADAAAVLPLVAAVGASGRGRCTLLR